MTAFFQNRFVQWVLLPIVVIWALGWTYYQLVYPTCTFRYKLTAEVMTPDGVKSGSSVIEVSYSSKSPLPNPGRWRDDKLHGESVYVDLGKGKNLFVLLTNNESSRTKSDLDGYGGSRDNSYSGALRAITLPFVAFGFETMPGHERAMQRQEEQIPKNRTYPIKAENFPTLVSFKNLNEENSVELVDPSDLSVQFGPGYRISKLEIELTDEPVSQKIDTVLTWLDSKRPKDGILKWNRADPLIDRLQYLSFKQ